MNYHQLKFAHLAMSVRAEMLVKLFLKLRIAYISEVVFTKGKGYKNAHVKILEWFDNSTGKAFFNRLVNHGVAKVVYDDPHSFPVYFDDKTRKVFKSGKTYKFEHVIINYKNMWDDNEEDSKYMEDLLKEIDEVRSDYDLSTESAYYLNLNLLCQSV
jgi:hypothetical protein